MNLEQSQDGELQNKSSGKLTTSTTSCLESQSPTVREIVNKYLQGVDWMDETWGKCMCPGHLEHTAQPAKRDARIYVNGVPTLYCFHEQCREQVSAVNSKIRAAWSLFQPELNPEELKKSQERAAHKHALESRAKAGKDQILKEFAWPVKSFDSGKATGEQFEEWLTLFGSGDIIWIGDPSDSGHIKHADHFVETYKANKDNGRYSCASTFKPGSYSRRNLDVLTTPYLIVEGDAVLGKVPETDEERSANKDACGAIFRWLFEKCGLNLRAVIDSGNKSLHGWFDIPTPMVYEELRVVLPALGCDRAMFKPTQPARIPGVIRENGNAQKLLYFK